ncbi:ATPase AAA [Brachionus plicatilis]|uniref:ATPase AAA n=1 Tax=Brachionus plicatilis TaxID=10195 RepID=A0A3M7R5S4_BRAPC|nr:ATPase AAA [Brachionus plicatilis]
MFSPPTTSKRPHTKSPDSGSTLSSPGRKKVFTEPKTAIGVNTFKKLVEESTIFIDKSLFIREFIENPAEVLLITCPRRWGKSINMDMIETFLEIEVDQEGKKYSDKTKTRNYKLFQGTSTIENLEAPLNIAQDKDFKNKYDQYQGEYPVISIDFKNAKGTSCQEHEYMIDILDNISMNNKLTRSQKKKAAESLTKFERLYENDGQEATDIDVQNSLHFLSELLHTHFCKKAYILIDEYDTPINNILQSDQFTGKDLDSILMLLRTMMGTTFKGNEHLAKGLITGVFRLAKSSLFSDLNNIVEYNFLNNHFARYYGFTEDDIKYLFNEYKIAEEDQQKAQSWYDGYRFNIDKTLKIFNPWAIVNFLSTRVIRNYWEESGNIDFIKKLFKIDAIKAKVQSLLGQEDTEVQLEDLKFSKDNFITLKELLNAGDNYKIEEPTVDLFFSYIFAAGYLTISEKQKYESTVSIKLPNQEVKSELEKKLVSFYKHIYNIDPQLFKDATDVLSVLLNDFDQDTNTLKNTLEKLFSAFPKFINIKQDIEAAGVHGNEDIVHSAINYVALQIKCLSKFGTEVWYKKQTRADIMLINNKAKLGMIIELKYDGSADEALSQAKKYLHLFKEYHDIKSIKSLGINVSKDKKVEIKSSVENLFSITV